MKNKLLISFSAIALIGLSTVAYGGWSWFSKDADPSKSRPSGAVPKGDCLEMMCEHGCVEKDGTYEGFC